jgi:hypothetical protein
VELRDIKGRLAVGLVESVVRRAGFAIGRIPASGGLAPLARVGREDLGPDFAAVGPTGAREAPDGGSRLVEVGDRPRVSRDLAIQSPRGGQSVFALAPRHWPELRVGAGTLGARLPAQDLAAHTELPIDRQNVEEPETLRRRMFALLTGSP